MLRTVSLLLGGLFVLLPAASACATFVQGPGLSETAVFVKNSWEVLNAVADIIEAVDEGDAWVCCVAWTYKDHDLDWDTTESGDPWFAEETAKAEYELEIFGVELLDFECTAWGKVSRATGEMWMDVDLDKDCHDWVCGGAVAGGLYREYEVEVENDISVVVITVGTALIDPVSCPSCDSADDEPMDPFVGIGFDLTDPFGFVYELDVLIEVFYCDVAGDYRLNIDDPTGTLTQDHFQRSVTAEGAVVYELKEPTQLVYEIPAMASWPAGSRYSLETIVTTGAGVPEPAGLLLFGAAALICRRCLTR